MTYLGAETFIIDEWIEQQLAATAGLVALVSNRIYNTYASTVPDFPFVIYQQQTLADVRGVGSARIMVNCLYVVKGIAQGPDFSGLADVAAQIDLAMTMVGGGSVSGGVVITSVREEPFALTEVEDGRIYRHLGGVYRIYAQAT